MATASVNNTVTWTVNRDNIASLLNQLAPTLSPPIPGAEIVDPSKITQITFNANTGVVTVTYTVTASSSTP